MNLRPFLAAAALTLAGHAVSADTIPAASALGQSIGISGAMPDFDHVNISSPNVYDYTFASAPTDWRVQSGVWEMTNRWACSPGWSWFGGRSDETATVWNKRKFSGDISVQCYFAFKMGLSGTAKWMEFPHDMGVTIGGDGQSLGSGYSFLVGADNNTLSVLRKGSEVVAENRTREALLPIYTDGNPDAGQNSNVVHRRWWYVRVDKIGSTVSCYLDNKLLFSYNDPKPLDVGQVALWTYNNGIMLSRVQVYYQNEVRPAFTRQVSAPVQPTPPIQSVKAAQPAKAPVKIAAATPRLAG